MDKLQAGKLYKAKVYKTRHTGMHILFNDEFLDDYIVEFNLFEPFLLIKNCEHNGFYGCSKYKILTATGVFGFVFLAFENLEIVNE
jgi:hypothetical protein